MFPVSGAGSGSDDSLSESGYVEIPASDNPYLTDFAKEYIVSQGYDLSNYPSLVSSDLYYGISSNSLVTSVSCTVLAQGYSKTFTLTAGQTFSDVSYNKIFFIYWYFPNTYSFQANQDWTISYIFPSAQLLRGFDLFIGGEDVEIVDDGSVIPDPIKLSGDVYYSHFASESGGLYEGEIKFTPQFNATNPLVFYWFRSNRAWQQTDEWKYNLGFTSLDVTYEEQKEGILEGVKGFFSELGDKITQWFNNLKSWFTELGDRISGFFTELGNKITGAFDALKNWFDEHIIQPVEEWWQGVLDWFEYNFTIPDGYFDTWRDSWEQWLSDHFGFLYDAGTLISDVFTSIMDVFSGESPNTLDIPQIKLPDILGGAVLIEAQTFNFDEFVDSIPALATIYGIYVTCMYGAALFAIIKLGQNTLEEILTDRQVTE